jgi:hypothetical protein
MAQMYLVQSIDKAVAMRRIDIISRSITLVEDIQKQDVSAFYATEIVEYAQNALQKIKGEKN